MVKLIRCKRPVRGPNEQGGLSHETTTLWQRMMDVKPSDQFFATGDNLRPTPGRVNVQKRYTVYTHNVRLDVKEGDLFYFIEKEEETGEYARVNTVERYETSMTIELFMEEMR